MINTTGLGKYPHHSTFSVKDYATNTY
jgi:hypothetical protein